MMEFKEIVLLILIAPLLIGFLCVFIITFLQFIQLIKDVMYNIKIVIRNIMKVTYSESGSRWEII